MHWLLCAAMAVALAACASIGRPQGGLRDETPPQFVRSNPGPMARNVNRTQLEIIFDENVQLDDAFNKVIVSPVQKTPPAISANGRRVSVELKDTLQQNTTYSVAFGDAIKDLNEGNILDGFTLSFSTGDSIDSLRISGLVLEARTLEPAQGILVGAYSNTADTAISTLPFERVCRTNQLGQFTLYNLKPGKYRVFALNDINRDYKWDRTEDVAFLDWLIEPYATTISVTDTLRGSDGKDSLSVRSGTAYFPNDVLLTWFNEDYKSQYLKDYKRPERRIINVGFSAPSDTLPEITIANGPFAGRNIDSWSVLAKNATLDTLQYWITDTNILAIDSLSLSMRYLRTDTNDQLSWTTDTLKFFFKDTETKKKKDKKKDDEEADSVPKMTFLSLSAPATVVEVYNPAIIRTTEPIDTFITDAVRLEMKVDTVWQTITDATLVRDSITPLTTLAMHYPWADGEKYRLSIDSAAVTSVYGIHNKKFEYEFSVKPLSDYSNLEFSIQGLDSLPAVVELLSAQDAPIATAAVIDGKATFRHLNPGTAYARLYIDKNGNGKWDTGNLIAQIQPEEVYYYPKKLNLRKNWDITQDWNIYENNVDTQKPWDIIKNKPKLKKGERDSRQSDDDEDEYEDDGGFGYGGAGTNSYGRDPYNTNRRDTYNTRRNNY